VEETTADPSTTLLRSSGRDDKGRAVTFRKISDLDGQSYEPLLQLERDVDAACGAAGKLGSAAADHDILLAVDHIGCGCCCARERQQRLPQDLSCAAVEGSEFFVVGSRAYE